VILHLVLTPTANNIGNDGTIKLSEALKSNSSLTRLDLSCNSLIVASFSRIADNNIGSKGAIGLSEALKANTSLTSLDLRGINLLLNFILTQQVMLLATKEQLHYLKH
jgi:hypothetical protein